MSPEREGLARAIDDHLGAEDTVRVAEDNLARAQAFAAALAHDVAALDAHEAVHTGARADAMKAALAEGRPPDFDCGGHADEIAAARTALAVKSKATDAAVKSLEHDLVEAKRSAEQFGRERAWAAERVIAAEAAVEAEDFNEKLRNLRAAHRRMAALLSLRVATNERESIDVAGRERPRRPLALSVKALIVARDTSVLGDSGMTENPTTRHEIRSATVDYFKRLQADPEATL